MDPDWRFVECRSLPQEAVSSALRHILMRWMAPRIAPIVLDARSASQRFEFVKF
jgi:hypothetical protein